MTDKTLKHAKRLLQRHVPPEEAAALLGLSAGEIEFVAGEIRKEEGGPVEWPADDFFITVIEQLSEPSRRMFERGYEADEVCQRLGELVDRIGGDVLAQARERAFRAELDRHFAAPGNPLEREFVKRHADGDGNYAAVKTTRANGRKFLAMCFEK